MSHIFSRRNFLRATLGSIAAAAGGAGYVRWGEPHWLEVDRVDVRLSSGAGPRVRVLHLSDLHLSPVVSLDFIARAVALGLAQQPDVIALTGDFVTGRIRDADRYAAVLARLPAAAPTFACLGNHDGGIWSRRAGGKGTIEEALALLRAARIPCLMNESRSLDVRGQPLQIVGVGDLWSGMCNPTRAFAQTPARGGAWRLVLNHNPDAKDLLRPHDWDVVLCGHTHGGQVRLPYFGTPFAPVTDKRFVSGLHRWRDRWLYVTHGVGNLHGVRFNCRPQVSVLELA
jgi:predicted MPP superfamily phosphohydrolase